MFKILGIISICIYIIVLYFLRTYHIINNHETVLLTVICLMLLLFLRYLFDKGQ